MALSMFMRSPACLYPVFRQSVARLATQPSVVQSNLPASAVLLKNASSLIKAAKSTPILDSVRSLRTSAVRRTFAKDEHSHDHAKLWVIERATTALLVPLIPAALIYPNKILDVAVAILITAHGFWGLEACVLEYFRTIVVGHLVQKLALLIVYTVSVVQLAGLLYLALNGMGIANAFWKIWLNMTGTGKEDAKFPPPTGFVEPKGLEAIAVDYVRAALFGPVIPKIAIALVYIFSIATLGGLFYLISHDVGFAQAVRDLWAIKAEKKA